MAAKQFTVMEDKELEKLMRFYAISQMFQRNGSSYNRSNPTSFNYQNSNPGIANPTMFTSPGQNYFPGSANPRFVGNDSFRTIDSLLYQGQKSGEKSGSKDLDTSGLKKSNTQTQSANSIDTKANYSTRTNGSQSSGKGGYFMVNPTFVVQYTIHLAGDMKQSGTDGKGNSDSTKTTNVNSLGNNYSRLSNGNKSSTNADPNANIQYILASLVGGQPISEGAGYVRPNIGYTGTGSNASYARSGSDTAAATSKSYATQTTPAQSTASAK